VIATVLTRGIATVMRQQDEVTREDLRDLRRDLVRQATRRDGRRCISATDRTGI
jgi:hypothetical protein